MLLSAENISLIMGIASFIAAVIFFFAARKSENHTVKLLSKIKNQTNTLERINDNLLGGLIHHLAKSHERIIDTVISNKIPEKESLSPEGSSEPNDETALYIMLYYHSARACYFARHMKVNTPLTDENKTTHVAADSTIHQSQWDFKIASDWIDGQEPKTIQDHRLYNYYSNTKEYWKPYMSEPEAQS